MTPLLGALWGLAAAQAPSALAGTWELDVAASEDVAPLMEALAVPAALRAMAPKKAPDQQLVVRDGELSVTVDGLRGRRTEVLKLDGKTPNKADVMGTAVELTTTVEAGAVISKGTVTVEGKPQPLKLSRTVDADVMTVRIWVGERTVKRVYRRRR